MEDLRMENYTRVTEILSPFSDYDQIPEAILNAAADRGTEIHKICEVYAKEGVHLPSPHDGYVQAFIKWYDREVNKLILTEQRIFDDVLEITGQFDLLVSLKPDVEVQWIVDIKTCAGVHDTWPVQLAAYQYLLERSTAKPDFLNIKRAVLHLKKDGNYKFYPYENDEKDREIFMSALRCYRYFKKG